MLARVVEQNAAHLRGRDGQKMSAAFHGRVLIHQADVSFMHQRGGLQRVLAALAAEIGASQAVQFVIHQRQKLVHGVLLPAPDLAQQPGYFPGIFH